MNKILFISNTANFSKFNRPYMRWFSEQGWQVDYAASDDEQVLDCNTHYIINMVRSPFSLQNIKAIKKLQKILENQRYDIIHCHTNIGAMAARIAARKLRKTTGVKVIYTLHGAYFFKGASLFNWFIYYPVEKLLSHYTDALITINQEDYTNALSGLKVPSIYKINGVGIDLSQFFPVSMYKKNALRKQYGYNETDFIILYIAEFVERKNHNYLLRHIPALKKNIPNLKIILAGKGILLDRCKKTTESLGGKEIIDFVGYRNDINIFCQIADMHISVSKMEGLSLNNIEAMAPGLPVVCSKIRGHTDVVTDGRNGFLFELNNPSLMLNSIARLYNDVNLRYKIGQNNIEDVKKYSLDSAISNMAEIYKKYM